MTFALRLEQKSPDRNGSGILCLPIRKLPAVLDTETYVVGAVKPMFANLVVDTRSIVKRQGEMLSDIPLRADVSHNAWSEKTTLAGEENDADAGAGVKIKGTCVTYRKVVNTCDGHAESVAEQKVCAEIEEVLVRHIMLVLDFNTETEKAIDTTTEGLGLCVCKKTRRCKRDNNY